MSEVYSFIKAITLKWLPEKVLDFLKKIHYAKTFRSFKLEEEPDLKIVQYLVESGDYVVDIGANIGIYTKILSKLVGKNGRVYSLEPVPSTFEILCSNIKKSKINNVIPMNFAISDCISTAIMEIPYNSTYGENYYQANIVGNINNTKNFRHIEVKTVTIDSILCKNSDKISFIKCDVEGHEFACIKGAINFLEKARPAWLIEICNDLESLDSSAYLLLKLLQEKNYSVWFYDGKRLKKRVQGDKSINYFFLCNEHIRKLKKQIPELIENS